MSQNTASNRSRGRNRNYRRDSGNFRRPSTPPPPKTFVQKVRDFFTLSWMRKEEPVQAIKSAKPEPKPAPEKRRQRTQSAPPPPSEVTSSRLYVGNLSYDATESDLFELFSSAGPVENAEVVTHSRTQRSKGYAFISMRGVDEAKRAVELLHDKEFMGRKLVVNGARPPSANRHEEA